MHPYIKPLKKLFEQNADPAQAPAMKKYMRDQFEYLGIKTPQSAALQKEFYDFVFIGLEHMNPMARSVMPPTLATLSHKFQKLGASSSTLRIV